MTRTSNLKTIARRLALTGAIGVAAIALMGCAGDLINARHAAKEANGFVGDMQRTTANAIQKQRSAHQGDQAAVSELKALAEIRKASSGRHVATWEGDDTEDSLKVYQAMLALTADDDLTKTAPFVMMTPLPAFNAPAIDDKAFTDLMTKLSKLSQRMSVMGRIEALIPFIKSAVKAYGDSADKAKNVESVEPNLGSVLVKAQEENNNRLQAKATVGATEALQPPALYTKSGRSDAPYLTLSDEGKARVQSDLGIPQPTNKESFAAPAPGAGKETPVTSLMNALQ